MDKLIFDIFREYTTDKAFRNRVHRLNWIFGLYLGYDDVANDMWIALNEKDLTAVNKMEAYLARFFHNFTYYYYLNIKRKERNREKMETEHLREDDEMINYNSFSSERYPQQELDLSNILPSEQSFLDLRFKDGLSFSEMSDKLGIDAVCEYNRIIYKIRKKNRKAS